ncbi:uncharacterized protein CCOS01_03416 [Colletotrichum costaricense]|uniref:DUF1330 domain-containing protein n=1 Tax=Colletotrichum costaricense TaxID=1209916 RepID=A0AAI9Z5B0_9PEZI|nr:uncharacterized protein CCOS01_03416 [Colletotrichum costaricense]KAK1534664.1 hypothetical protein CCOS01_03416 [Colletotrichum costaricense]
MPATELTDIAAVKDAIGPIDPNKPVYMLNILKFRPVAIYDPTAPADFRSLPACSGQDAWQQRYVPAFFALPTMNGTRVPFSGKMVGKVLGLEDDDWDEVALVQYENIGVFRDTIASEEYKRLVVPHRVAALADARLFAFEFSGSL